MSNRPEPLPFHDVEFQLEEFQLEEFQLEDDQSAVEFQLEEFQLEELQLDEFQLEEFQLEATVPPLRQGVPGAHTSAGTPWFALPGAPARFHDALRLSEPTFEFLGFEPCFATSAHLTLSGL
jgi:hypothetical protein